MSNSLNEGLVALSDIADLAGVSRAAVSKWRKQRPGFPDECAGTISRPLFSRDEVETWLRDNGYSAEVDRGAASLRILAAMNQFGAQVDASGIRTFVVTILCARKLADGTANLGKLQTAAADGVLLEALARIARDSPPESRWRNLVNDGLTLASTQVSGSSEEIDLEPLARGIFEATDSDSAAEVSDLVLERLGATDGRPAGAYGAVDSRVAQLLADLSAHATGVIYDPACGIGQTLLTIWKQSANQDKLHLIGHEVNEEYVLACRQRFFLHDVEADIVQADVLLRDPDPTLRADVIVAEPPLSAKMPAGFSVTDSRWTLAGLPPQNNSETAWLQHIVAHLNPKGGRGLVITSANTTFATDSIDIRSALVRQGCVETVVALPRRFLTHTSVAPTLWRLFPRSNPSSSSWMVGFIDASAIAPEDCNELTFAEWRARGRQPIDRGIRFREVPLAQVVADDRVNLDPRYWNQYVAGAVEREARRERALSTLQKEIQQLIIPKQRAVSSFRPAEQSVTLRALERQGVARIMQSRSTTRRDSLRENDESLRTERGDVLVVKRPQISVTVDTIGGNILEAGTTIVRLDRTRFLPEYIAECLGAKWNRRTEAGGEIFASGIRDLEIPKLSLLEQERVIDEIGQVRRLGESARRIASAADDLAAAQLETIKAVPT